MIKKFSIIVTILFSLVLFSCSHSPNDSKSNVTVSKTYKAIVDNNYEIAKITKENGNYKISFGLGANSFNIAADNCVSGIAQRNGDTYTSTNVMYNDHLPTRKQTAGTLTITVTGNTATVKITDVSKGYLDGDYELTESNE